MEKLRPKITYKKWWHRFIPKYRRQIKFLDIILEREWKNGLEERNYQHLKNALLYGKYYEK